MRFGLFIPQGWRMDLVGIDPAQHWGVMAGLAQRADDGDRLGVDLGLRPLPHRAAAHRGGHPRGVDPHGGASRRVDRAGSASARCAPAWATATPPTWPRSPRPSTSSPGPHRDGHRRRLVRARVARLRLRLPRRRRAARGAARGRRRSSATCGPTGSATLDGQALPGRRRPLLPAAAAGHDAPGQPAQRHPDVDRRRRREEDPADRGRSTPTTPTSTAGPRGSAPRARSSSGHCDDLGRDFGDDRALGQLQRRHRRDRGRRRRTGSPGSATTTPGRRWPTQAAAAVDGPAQAARGRHAGADRRDAVRTWRSAA